MPALNMLVETSRKRAQLLLTDGTQLLLTALGPAPKANRRAGLTPLPAKA
jgi:hypothetical protein